MSEPSLPAQDTLGQASTVQAVPTSYQLSDDLARLCLPREFKDAYRRLAWVDSICLLFLLIGLVGLKPPKVVQKPLSKIEDVVPVIFTPPEEPQKADPDVKPDDLEPPPNAPTDAPQVVTVVAAADSSSVAFAVPVQGAVAIAPAAHLATPPPPVVHQTPPTATRFNPDKADGGSYPPPDYPSSALRNRYQGTVTLEFNVDPDGKVTSIKVQKTSGFSVLDESALALVKTRWRFPQGTARLYYWSCTFQLQ